MTESLQRTPLYDTHVDPDCVNNLIGDPACQDALAQMRTAMDQWHNRNGRSQT